MAPVTLISFSFLFATLLWEPLQASARWQTLSGRAPLVIARGGTSALYPDQTAPAYEDALNYSLPGVILTCDLQMAQSQRLPLNGTGICRTNLNLINSTVIAQMPELASLNNTYVVNGVPTFGFYAIDIDYETLANVGAAQSVASRTPAYDGILTIQKPEFIAEFMANFSQSVWWLNSEYTAFTEANSNLDATRYLQQAIEQFQGLGYVSVNEIRLLRTAQSAANSTGTKLIYKFMDAPATMDPSTNQSYTSLLRNLTFIRTLADGILVPKSYIWPINSSSNYLTQPTTLVNDAHKVNLEVYAYNFDNDQFPNAYNYTLDPIREILYFIESYGFSVDGIMTSFPTTASEAISCYSNITRNVSVDSKQALLKKQKVISHNGASGEYPASTLAAYTAAIDAHVDYIDCNVQLSQDGVPFCRPTVNLVVSTNVPINVQGTSTTSYPDLNNGAPGVFPFQFMWDEIKSWSSIAYSPNIDIPRDPNYNGQFGILSLADFLAIAQNHSVGALITIQNALFLRENQNLAVVDSVVQAVSVAGYGPGDNIMMQSDESAVLARLRTLNVSYPLMFLAAWTKPTPPAVEKPFSLSVADLTQIKQYATAINVYERLVNPFDNYGFLRGPSTQLIKQAHDLNLTVYYQYERNEPTSFAFDLRIDPTLQLFSLANLGIDGFITDHPTTVMNYLDNQCAGYGGATSSVNFTIPLVVPGVLSLQTPDAGGPVAAPAPNLVVPEPVLTGVTAPAPSPPAQPSPASRNSPVLLSVAVWIAFNLIL